MKRDSYLKNLLCNCFASRAFEGGAFWGFLEVKKKKKKGGEIPEEAIGFFGGCILETALEQSQAAVGATLRGGSVAADVR